jgi:uncharacterized protein (TIGR00725 family)
VIVIGVMGGGQATEEVREQAYRLGALIAKQGWVLLNGGRAAGVMDASAKGAKEAGGLTVGILPDRDRGAASDWIDIPVRTGMGDARNTINVLSSDLVIACPGGAGTLSEIALALKSGRKVILLGFEAEGLLSRWLQSGQLFQVATPEEAIDRAQRLLDES